MTRTTKPATEATGKLEKVMFRLPVEQLQALRKEALRRAAAIGSMKPNASELVREAVAKWLARLKK